jgi:hypothetical protein
MGALFTWEIVQPGTSMFHWWFCVTLGTESIPISSVTISLGDFNNLVITDGAQLRPGIEV